MGWWKNIQNTLHPPTPRPGHTPLLDAGVSSPPLPLWSAPSEKPQRASTRVTLLRIIAAMAAFTLLGTILSISSITHSPTHLLLDSHTRIVQVWERFPELTGYYKGLFTLIETASNIPEYPPGMAFAHEADARIKRPDAIKGDGRRAMSRVWNPYPEYASEAYRRAWEGEWSECSFGEVGGVARERPEVRVFDGTPEGMPGPVFGAYELVGVNEDVCFDRYGRLGPYGYGYSAAKGGLGEAVYKGGKDEKDIETGWGLGSMPIKKIDWRGVDWGRLQDQCLERNKNRFGTAVGHGDALLPGSVSTEEDVPAPHRRRGMPGGSHHIIKKNHPRTAVVLRAWTGYKYTAPDLASIRSLISELSILSGGEYTVHLFVHVKDPEIPIWASKTVYQKTLRENVPEEFWGIAELWNEPMMRTTYDNLPPGDAHRLPLHGVYRSTFMPMQWFATRHPEYEFFWNWELDVRYTGHYYHFFDAVQSWAKKQPRRNLWERNERFYIPEVHGSWDAFSAMVAATSDPTTSVWGPVSVEGVHQFPDDPVPPLEESAHSSWGVGEDADLITFNPLFDPEGTTWGLASDTTGYSAPPPRRSAIVAASRLSRRLLARMHTENAHSGHAMFSEMWPASCALHHGFKAVFAPHPVYVDRRWPALYLEGTFNNGVNGTSGGREQSVFGVREHNFKGTTWYYDAEFAATLWRRWVGREAKGEGGEAYDRRLGRMCLKGVLLHPVKGE